MVGTGIGTERAADGTTLLRLPGGAREGENATIGVPAGPRDVVTLTFDARLGGAQGTFAASLTCFAASGSRVEQESNEGAASVPRDGAWHTARVTTPCPAGTASVRVLVQNDTDGELDFRDPRLTVVTPPSAAP
jgi:hypothetical protein